MNGIKIQSYRELEVWQLSIDLADRVYDATAPFPREELYGLISQTRRSAVSIASNIAEGSARASSRELIQFLSIARGSLAELETQLIISHKRRYLDDINLASLLETSARINRMLTRLQQSIEKKAA